jgi:hypothetical protein
MERLRDEILVRETEKNEREITVDKEAAIRSKFFAQVYEHM